jgi:hypothetical protein
VTKRVDVQSSTTFLERGGCCRHLAGLPNVRSTQLDDDEQGAAERGSLEELWKPGANVIKLHFFVTDSCNN